MNETFDIINDYANYTSAGTSQLSVNTSEGVEQIEVENLSRLDSDLKNTDLGRLYRQTPESFAKIQKITFRNKEFYNCYLSTNTGMTISKFDAEGALINEDAPAL